ncbi:MAG: LrgB family protein [Betaproteobacteria bacterium]|jgi:predicted murein hydrolase (TIGR00659 family)|nr:LrgB family protein [Betaproteobacteria bacterium]
MTRQLGEIWVYLSATPLLGLTVTLLAYLLAYRIYERVKFNPLANPVAISVVLLVLLLWVTRTPYLTYFEGAQFVHFLLGPATVALAVPLYDQRAKLRRLWLPLTLGLTAGVLTAIVSAVAIAWALGASKQTLLSLAPKSVTTPIAMGIAEKIGGLPSLTAVFVILTGMTGAIIARPLLNALKIAEHPTRGFAVGVASHGIGTARAFQVSEEMGAFAGLAMGLTALLTAVVAPALAPWLVAFVH